MPKKRKVSVADVAEVIVSGIQSDRMRQEELRVLVLVEPGAERDVVIAVRDALVPEAPNAQVWVRSLGEAPSPAREWDLVVAVMGEAGRATEGALAFARCGVPASVVAPSALDVSLADVPESVSALVGVIAASTGSAVAEPLARWAIDVLGEKSVAFAASFPFARPAKVRDLARSFALENAAVGAVEFVPGADLPVMCLSQARMALEIAASYNQPVSPATAADVLAVVGAAFAYRGLARAVSGVVPGLSWLLKAAVGYAGTLATARGLAFVHDSPELPQAVRDAVARALDLVAARLGGGSGTPALGGGATS